MGGGLFIKDEWRLDMYHADSHFEIGSGHQVCQDFAVHGEWQDKFQRVVWGIVSDGCSGSPNTDTGARILTHMMNNVIKYYLGLDPLLFCLPVERLKDKLFYGLMGAYPNKMSTVCNMVTSLGLGIDSLDATLWVLLSVTSNGKTEFKVVGWGDGEVVVRKKEGYEIHSVDYPTGAPYYLSYRFDKDRNLKYWSSFGGTTKHEVVRSDLESVTLTPGSATDFSLSIIDAESDVVSVSVFTDGLKTYNRDVNESEPRRDLGALLRVTDFQGFEGVFLQRRMKAIERRDQKERILHHDDIGGASIALLEQ
jgi:hypothetical protein